MRNANDPTGALAEGQKQMRNARAMPATGGIGHAPNSWEEDDIRIDRQIDHETEIALESYDCYEDLIEHCAGNVGFENALHSIVTAWRDLNSRPMSLSEHRKIQSEVESNVALLVDAFEDVARVRVGECVERGESYVYEASDEA